MVMNVSLIILLVLCLGEYILYFDCGNLIVLLKLNKYNR